MTAQPAPRTAPAAPPAAPAAPAVLVVADDLSGAADSAVAFADRADTVVLLDATAPLPPAAAVSVDTDSRYADPDTAAARAAAAVRRAGQGTLVYKKIDSTLRGNIGPELRGALTALGTVRGARHLAVVAPAFPATGRTVEGGVVLVAGEPVTALHPGRTPLVDHLRAAGLTVRLLGLRELRTGDPARALADAVGRVDAVVVDATTDDDLARTMAATTGLPVLPTGSAGLAHHLRLPAGTPPRTARHPSDAPDAVRGPVLAVVGSRSAGAAAQCRALAEGLPAVPLPVTSVPADTARAARELRSALRAGRHTLLLPDPALPVEPARAQEIAAALAATAAGGADAAGALLATGGETARATLLAIGARVLTVEGESEPGVVRARTADGLTVVTKAGAFGDAGTLLRAARSLAAPGATGARTATAPAPHRISGPPGALAPHHVRKDDSMSKPVIALTMGDAAGVGPEVIVKALAGAAAGLPFLPFVVGDAARLRRAIEITGVALAVHPVASVADAAWQPGTVDCLDLADIPADLPFGELSPVAGEGAYRYVEAATRLASDREVDAICTAPLNKEALHAAGHQYPGHTELLAELTGTPEVSMLLSAPKLRVIHVTTHIGLVDAVARIDPGLVERTIRRGHATLVAAGVAEPRIAVCGINPHAGENGLFGHGEEESKVVPGIEAVRADGIDARGPLPADTVFFRAVRGDFDLVVAMYHDQGHGPVKVLGLDAGVNITVGLPVIRTSVDHGTAFDIAGTGRADEASMVEALRQAVELAPRREGAGSGGGQG
ncbi:4-hydroxythreonine-4-phosphate dehydrogenase PdxA [Streptomyces sp. NPDC050560]|uniref:4-hydroxythreonine-4-phosphate dehydrogenase PdxA n=1 Tax=Streptomyces sp. NPDC050560 TaxID=3365630 RepID=UPI0037939909